MWKLRFFFFFFQAEDGIRDTSVTGVQTCALPISSSITTTSPRAIGLPLTSRSTGSPRRSEERRVGKSVDLGGRRIIKKKKKRKKRKQDKNKKTKKQKTKKK